MYKTASLAIATSILMMACDDTSAPNGGVGGAGTSSSSSSAAGSGGGGAASMTMAGGAVLIVHCEPQNEPAVVSDGSTGWEKLTALVTKSSEHEVVLSLLFARPWALYAVADDARLDQVVGWVEAGHQIGFHHHDVTHAAQPAFANCGVDEADWETGWTNAPWAVACQSKHDPTIGFDALVGLQDALWQRLAPDVHTDINFGCHGTEGGMRTFEWQASHIRYSQTNAHGDTRSPVSGTTTLARTHCATYAGVGIAEIGSYPFVTVKPTGPTGEAVANDLTHPQATPDDYAVVSFHAVEYAGSGREAIDDLIERVGALGASRLATEVLADVTCP